jgi:alkylmercury lyase
MQTSHPSVTSIFAALSAALPEFSQLEQRVALELYRQLARGQPVRSEVLAPPLELAPTEITAALGGGLISLIYYDDAGQIIGFGGLAVVTMGHRFIVNGRKLYTWCAWDGLFIPELLGASVDLESTCPQTGTTIRLRVDPRGVRAAEPPETVMSFVLPDGPSFDKTSSETIASFCHYVFFLASLAAGAEWVHEHEGTFLLTLDDAFRLGQMKNAARFGAVLARARGSGTDQRFGGVIRDGTS